MLHCSKTGLALCMGRLQDSRAVAYSLVALVCFLLLLLSPSLSFFRFGMSSPLSTVCHCLSGVEKWVYTYSWSGRSPANLNDQWGLKYEVKCSGREVRKGFLKVAKCSNVSFQQVSISIEIKTKKLIRECLLLTSTSHPNSRWKSS